MKRSRTSKAMATTRPSFSQEIITAILSRLPVKSIIRFKCISKTLHTLIETQDFISKHLHRSAQNPFILARYYDHLSGYDPGLMLISEEESLHNIELPLLKGLSCFPRVVGSCNGLICLDVSSCFASSFVLYNFGTRQYKLLPKPLLMESPSRKFWMVATGFGYNLNTDDYMLVRIIYFQKADGDASQAEVYKRSTGFWEEIEKNIGSCVISGGQEAVALNGVLHWMANGVGVFANRKLIISFDMNQEVFRRIVLPKISPESYLKTITYENSLALAIYPGFRSLSNRFELWVMTDGKYWTKRFSMGLFPRLSCPIGSYEGSQVIVKREDELFLMKPGSKEIIRLPLNADHYTFKVYNYVESLVSVHGGNKAEE